MFVGHYAAAFALKGKVKASSLGGLLIATKFVDMLFFPFALAGIEHIRFEDGFTAVNNFDMYFYPFMHGVLGRAVLGLLFFLLYKYLFNSSKALP